MAKKHIPENANRALKNKGRLAFGTPPNGYIRALNVDFVTWKEFEDLKFYYQGEIDE